MFSAWGSWVARWRWLVLLLSAAAVAAAGVWGPGVVSRLSTGGFGDPDAPSAVAAHRIEQTVGRQEADVVALYSSTTLTVDDPAFERAVTAALATMPPGTAEQVLTPWGTGSPALVSADRHTAAVVIRLAAADRAARSELSDRLADGLRADDPAVTTRLGGPAALDSQINRQVGQDLARAESLSFPVLLLLLVVVFGSLVAAGLPLLVGVTTVLGSFVAIRILAGFTEVSIFAINIITLLGLGLSIDYALFVVSRFREQLRAGDEVPAALATTMATAGRTVSFSAITVALSLAGLLLFPQAFLRSMGYGGIATVVVAATAALTALPALLAVLGRRVDALRIRPPRRPTTRRAGSAAGSGFWERHARTVMRRPLLWAGAVTALLVVLALPFTHVQFGGIDARALPSSAEGRIVAEVLERDFSGLDSTPIEVLVDGARPADVAAFADRIAGLPNVTGVRTAAAASGTTLLAVGASGSAVDAGARGVVSAVRALPPPPGARVDVGGIAADQVDLRASLAARLPWMALLVATTTLALLFLAFGSLVIPLKAIVVNLLSLGAAFGVVTWIFQDGHLSEVLSFTSTGTVETTQPILILAIVFGLSMDYEVFLLSRIREQWDATGQATEAVAGGLQRTGRIITSAALLLVVVIAAFSTSGVAFVKLIGVGMAVAVVLDATVVRAILVPALVGLLGPAAWWAPAPMLRWWRRHGVRDLDPHVGPTAGDPAGTARRRVHNVA